MEIFVMNENLVLPLNYSSRQGYIDDFEAVPPPRIDAYLALFRTDVDFPLPDDPREPLLSQGVLAADKEYSQLDIPKSGQTYLSTITLGTYTLPEFPFLLDGMNASEQSWVFDNIFLDLAFFEDTDITCDDEDEADMQTLHGVAGMRFLNRWHIATGSIEPAHHFPMVMPGIQAYGYRNVVGDVFEKGAGVWIRSLAGLRTRSLVFARAILQGRDPVVEWERFCALGGKLHFEYPVICP
jgi:hypothetical protein